MRLGPYVLETVADKLHQEGIHFFPNWIIADNKAPRQWQEVRLVELDPNSPIYRAAKAIEDPTEDGDAFLCELATNSATASAARADSQLQRVRGALKDAIAILDEPKDAEVAEA